jgi:hypothetical protein
MEEPASKADEERRAAAWARLLARLKQQKPVEVPPWTREELYDEEAGPNCE